MPGHGLQPERTTRAQQRKRLASVDDHVPVHILFGDAACEGYFAAAFESIRPMAGTSFYDYA